MAAATTRSSSSCMGFFRTGTTHPSRPRTRATSTQPSRKADGVAMWLINGVTAAFFASLQHCCIRIQTHEENEPDEENGIPLIYNDGIWRADQEHINGSRKITGATRRSRNKSKNMSHEALNVDQN